MARFALIIAFIIGTLAASGPAPAQSPPPAPPNGSAADALVFQGILVDFLQKRAGKPQPAERDQFIADYDSLLKRLDALTGSADVEMVRALCLARRASILLEKRRDLDLRIIMDKVGERPEDKFATDEDRKRILSERVDMSARVAAEYALVQQSLGRALELAERDSDGAVPPEQVLIKGVIGAQAALAMLHKADATLDRKELDADKGRSGVAVDSAQIRILLTEAANLLDSYVKSRNIGLDFVRGRFYQAVVNYRLALDIPASLTPGKGTQFASSAESSAALVNAKRFFEELSVPERVYELLLPSGNEEAEVAFSRSSFRLRADNQFSGMDCAQFYAASSLMYLGLIELISANDPALSRPDQDAAKERAKDTLRRAQLLDKKAGSATSAPVPVVADDRGGESSVPVGESLTNNLISSTVDLVINTVRDAPVGEAEPINDFHIAGGIAGLYDSNVTLLGRNTEAPLDKRRKSDFRGATLLRLDYSFDLNALPGQKDNEFLRKWQVYFEARVAPTWNVRIHDFNEQFYGGTVNIRYEFFRDRENHGENADGRPIQGAALFMDWRYDYDLYLLGNDGFLKQNRVRPSLRYISHNEVFDASLFFAYEDRNYLEELRDERFDRDGNYFSWGADVGMDLSKIWPQLEAQQLYRDHAWGGYAPPREDYQEFYRPVRMRLGLMFTNNSTVGDEFDYGSGILSGGVTVPLPLGMDFSYDAIFEWQEYWQPSLVDRHRYEREDFIQEHQFRLSRRFFFGNYDANTYLTSDPLDLRRLVLTLYGDIRFTIDDSNVRDRLGQSIYEYNRVVYGAGLRFDLN